MNNSYKADYLIVGVGFAGVTFARMAAESGYASHLIERRKHIGGNCFTYTDQESQVEVHKYGPHIFHTNSKEVWEFIRRFTEFNHFVNRVKAVTNGKVFSLPISLLTINQFFGKHFNPAEAREFIKSLQINIPDVKNFEDWVLSSVGKELYEAFFKQYSIKQWGVDPKEISSSTAKRVPIRFTYDDNYYDDLYQGIPLEGYTKIFERMLDHPNIKVLLETSFDEYKTNWRQNYKKLIFTGSIDEYFDFCYGYLPYRTVIFKELRGTEIQGNAVINYTDLTVPYTRIHEHKWFTPEKKFDKSIAFEEYSQSTTSDSDPYYPFRNEKSTILYQKYADLSKIENDVIFIGRLAEFRYYDMHQVIASAMSKVKQMEKVGF